MSKLLNISIALDQYKKFSLVSSNLFGRMWISNSICYSKYSSLCFECFYLSILHIRFAELTFTWKLSSIFLQSHYSHRCSQMHTYNTNLLCNDFFCRHFYRLNLWRERFQQISILFCIYRTFFFNFFPKENIFALMRRKTNTTTAPIFIMNLIFTKHIIVDTR